MSVFYVSQQNGNNANSGLTAALAKKTLTGTGSLATVWTGVGDIARVAPGRYAEKPVFLANNQAIYADPLCLYFPSDTPGIVRITGANSSEVPTSGSVVAGNGYTGCSLNGALVNGVVIPLYVDGALGSYTILGGAAAPLACNYVYSESTTTPFEYCTATGCIGIGTSYAFFNCTSVDCLGIGGTSSVFGGTVTHASTNCMSIGGTYGFSQSTGNTHTVQNCYALVATTYGFYGAGVGGTAVTLPTTCYALFCGTGYGGTSTTYPLAVAGNLYCGSTAQRGSGYESGSPTLAAHAIFDAMALIRAFAPILTTATLGTGTGSVTDIIGAVLNPGSIGPYNAASGIKPAAWPMGMIQ